MHHDLTTGWTVRLVTGEAPDDLASRLDAVPAEVPGVVHTDLLAAGLITDPFVDDAEASLRWIGESDWEYRTSFDWSDTGDTRVDLVAEGLDTVAHVELNGVTVARTVNQHRSYRLPVAELLRPGCNDIVITFRSPYAYAREQEALLGKRPHSYENPFNAMRKAACNFGWDWGPDLASVGIWKPIGIHSWSGARIAAVRPLVDVIDGVPTVTAHVDVEWADTEPAAGAELAVEVAGQTALVALGPGQTSASTTIDAPGAALWWPRGYGEQTRHELDVRLLSETGDELSHWSRRIGFRSVEIDVAPDEQGSAFRIIVNGEDVYIRGANWIPDDVFFPRITRDTLQKSITDALESNMNMLRVWGGGIYESEDFYDLCDENGILVWQDFLLACAAYAEDDALWSEFEAEAVEAVTRLTAHPSLVVWNGGNENIWGYIDWNWRSQLGAMTWGEGYYIDLFPRIVRQLAPNTPYSEGSPFSFSRYVHPNDDAHGTMHIWDVWNRVDYTHYRDYRPRFVSEFGFQGPPAWSTLEYAVHDEPRDPFGPNMLVHQKADDGNGKLQRGLGEHLPQPDSYEDWHWTMQLNQARAVAYGIEHFRSLFPLNRGSIVWQLNDCWPVVSWAAVDSMRHRKPLWHALRRVYADRLLTIQPREGALVAVLHNDAAEALSTTVTLTRRSLLGEILAQERMPVEVDARSATVITVPASIASAADSSAEFVAVIADSGERAFWYFAEDPALLLQSDAVAASATEVPGGYAVRVEARSLVKDLTVLADKVDAGARAQDGLLTLLPGEVAEIRVQARPGLEPAAFTDPRVLRSANDLCDPRNG
ncbi:glycoside hydrolase family 2 protein [Microbacterium petrolearium]|jgi:beta-mannosidase